MFTAATKYIVLSIVTLLPIFFIPHSDYISVSKSTLVIFAACVLCFVVIIEELKRGAFVLPKTHIFTALLGLFVVTLLSALFSTFSVSSLFSILTTDTLLYVVAGIVFTYAVTRISPSVSYIKKTLQCIWVSALIIFVHKAIELTFGITLLSFGYFNSQLTLLGNWSETSYFFGFTLISALVWLQLSSKKKESSSTRKIAIATFIISLIATVAIYTPGVWWLVGLIAIGMFAYSFISTTKNSSAEDDDVDARKQLHIPTVTLVVVVVSFAMILLGSKVSPFDIFSRIPGLGFVSRYHVQYVEARPSLLKTSELSFNVLKNAHIFGEGPGDFYQAWDQYKPKELNNTILWSTQFYSGFSTIATSLVTHGILGGVMWILIILLTLRLAYMVIVGGKATQEQRVYAIVFALSTIFLSVMLLITTANVVMSMMFFVFVGYLISIASQMNIIKKYEYSFVKDPRVAFGSVCLLVIGMFATITIGYVSLSQVHASASSHKGGRLASSGDLHNASIAFANAIAYDERDIYYRDLLQVALLELSQFVQKNATSDESQKDALAKEMQQHVERIVGISKRIVTLEDHSYQNWFIVADAYINLAVLGVEGAKDAAKEALIKAESLSPQSPQIQLKLAELELVQKEYEKSLSYVDKAIELKSDYTEAYFFKAQVYTQNNALPKAVEAAEIAYSTAPNNADVMMQLGILRYNNTDYSRAREIFQILLARLPENANVQYMLALTLRDLGEKTEALKIVEQLQVTNPNNSDITKLLNSLKEVSPETETTSIDASTSQ